MARRSTMIALLARPTQRRCKWLVLLVSLLGALPAAAFYTDCSGQYLNVAAPECSLAQLDSVHLAPLTSAMPNTLVHYLDSLAAPVFIQEAETIASGSRLPARPHSLVQADSQTSGFYLNRLSLGETAPISAPFLLLLGALLTVVLVRAKRFNNK